MATTTNPNDANKSATAAPAPSGNMLIFSPQSTIVSIPLEIP